MRRRLRLEFLFAAALLQIAAPLAAYAGVAQLPDPIELCSAEKALARGVQRHGNPFQKPAHLHCAESLCCIGSTSGAAAPPATPLRCKATHAIAGPIFIAAPDAAEASIVAAAPARGPPERG